MTKVEMENYDNTVAEMTKMPPSLCSSLGGATSLPLLASMIYTGSLVTCFYLL